MLSKAQEKEKSKKIKETVITFLSDDKLTIIDVSKITGISSSSVQRYLHDPLIEEIFAQDSKEIIGRIETKLNQNYENGVKLGGTTFAANNTSIKDENGHFVGSCKK